ncbi:MAG: glutamate racemase [Verrucomicrobiota bacterium JB023]|nr:glutamate racemase [Verrucomicrobiota bacterium JB023]
MDSGVGGLSVWREVRALLPGEDLVYVGDSAFCPYGAKPPEVLRERVGGIVRYLISREAEVIVLACNSATIQAIEWCRETWPEIAFVGMEPGVKPAVAASRSRIIGVLATEASLTGEMFARLVERCGEGCRILTQACPRFVELVEEGRLSGEEAQSAVREYVEPLASEGADVLVLGCTHYPFLKQEVARLYPGMTLIDTGLAVARRVKDVLRLKRSGPGSGQGGTAFLTSGDPDVLKRLLPVLLGRAEDPDLVISGLEPSLFSQEAQQIPS